MKTVILAGGLGTRISEETSIRPKPMIEVGGKPLIWHIMKIYSSYGFTDFIVCLGYRGYVIKEYFANYWLHMADVTFDLATGTHEVHASAVEPWKVTLVETGESTMTGGRIKRVRDYLEPDEDFCLTYGDGVADVDLHALLAFHRTEGRLATVTAVQPPGRFGVLQVQDGRVQGFREKADGGWVSGGFFVLKPQVLDLIEGDDTSWEQQPLEHLAHTNDLSSYRHEGFWHPVDTLRDKNNLEQLWSSREAPWKRW